MRDIVKTNRLSGSITMHDPFDALYHINPEIATLAYAHKSKILTPEILPYVAKFRSLQSKEKIALLGSIVDKLGIESNERINIMRDVTARYGIDSNERKHGMTTSAMRDISISKQNGLTERARIQANTIDNVCAREQRGRTERELIHSHTALNLQKIKYEARYAIARNEGDVQKYLSDNELEATRVEAETLGGAIRFAAEARRDTELGKSQMGMETRIREAELSYARGIAKAEYIRDAATIKQRGEIIRLYIEKQAGIIREAAMGKAKATSEVYKTLQVFAKEGVRLLEAKESGYVRFSGNTSLGIIDLEIDMGSKK